MKIEHFQPVIDWWKNSRKEINIDGFDKAKNYSYQEIFDTVI